MAEVLVVASKVKDFIKDNDCQTSGELIDELSKKVEALLKDACKRTKENGRVTVKPCDL